MRIYIRSLVDLLRKSRTIETKFLIPFSINDPVRILVLKLPHSCEVDDLVCIKFVELFGSFLRFFRVLFLPFMDTCTKFYGALIQLLFNS